MWKCVAACVLVACAASPPKTARPVPLEVPPLPPGTRLAVEPLDAGPPLPAPPPLLTYEQALRQSTTDEVAPGTSSLTDQELAVPLRNASFIDRCGAPQSMKVLVRLVIHDGQALGVTVRTTPEDADIAACVDHAVRALRWPANAHYDSFSTTY